MKVLLSALLNILVFFRPSQPWGCDDAANGFLKCAAGTYTDGIFKILDVIKLVNSSEQATKMCRKVFAYARCTDRTRFSMIQYAPLKASDHDCRLALANMLKTYRNFYMCRAGPKVWFHAHQCLLRNRPEQFESNCKALALENMTYERLSYDQQCEVDSLTLQCIAKRIGAECGSKVAALEDKMFTEVLPKYHHVRGCYNARPPPTEPPSRLVNGAMKEVVAEGDKTVKLQFRIPKGQKVRMTLERIE